MEYGKLEKAQIQNIDKGDRRVVECLFNPTDYTFSKSNSWNDQKTGNNVPQVEFGGGQPATLQMELFFDTYADFETTGQTRDVRKFTDKIWELMVVDKTLTDRKNKKGRPPRVRFHWGKTWSFEAVITTLSQKFTMFLHDGTPVRATLNVTFQQIKDTAELKRQNPTSGGTGGERVWRVTEGDTLAWIAYQEYGDPTRWRPIADANRPASIRRLVPGSLLLIPNA